MSGSPAVQIIMKDVKGRSRIQVMTIGTIGATQHIVNRYRKLIANEDVESARFERVSSLRLRFFKQTPQILRFNPQMHLFLDNMLQYRCLTSLRIKNAFSKSVRQEIVNFRRKIIQSLLNARFFFTRHFTNNLYLTPIFIIDVQ